MNIIPICEARVGDYAQFRSGLRRIESVSSTGLRFIQLQSGRIGGRDWWKKTEPDGERTTLYLPSDLQHMGVTHARSSQ